MVTNILPKPDGHIWVYDTVRRALHLVDADLKSTNLISTRYRPSFMVDDNTYVHAEQIATPERVGQPIHLVRNDGSIIRSFGTDDPTYRANQPLRYDRVVAPGRGKSVWSAPPGRYVFERWDLMTGNRVQRLAVRSTWFRESADVPGFNERPPAVILALWERGDELWILSHDADTKWQPLDSAKERALDPKESRAQYDSVLDVVDIKTGQVIATRRFDDVVWGRAPSFLLGSLEGKSLRRVDVWEASLVAK